MSNKQETVEPTTAEKPLTFHWSYIILPLFILVLAVILAASFYHLLPVEMAYHFTHDGSPDRWTDRGVVILWTLLPQLLVTLLAGGVTWGIAGLTARVLQTERTEGKPEGILRLIGNMVAIAQIILCFAMLDIFLYNAYQIHLLPLWVFILIVLGLGAIILGVFFIRVLIQAWRTGQ